jgi:hypothetical protein
MVKTIQINTHSSNLNLTGISIMCKYCGTDNYRKIYECHFGSIPLDENNRKYEIHHIDGNRLNNTIENLQCLSIQEHYNIHFKQKDFRACVLIARKMKLSPEIISELTKEANQEKVKLGIHPFQKRADGTSLSGDKVANGTHHFLTRSDGTNINTDRITNGTHHLMRRDDGTSHATDKIAAGTHNFQTRTDGTNLQDDRVANGTHPFQKRNDGTSLQTDRVNNKTHNFLKNADGISLQTARIAAGTHPSQLKWICPNCGKNGKGASSYSQHLKKYCKFKSKINVQ